MYRFKVLESSSLPKSICLDCLTKLNQFNEFFSTTQENQVILQIIFGEKPEQPHSATPQKQFTPTVAKSQPALQLEPEALEKQIVEEITTDTALPDHDEDVKGESPKESNSISKDSSTNNSISMGNFPQFSRISSTSHKNKFERFDCHLCNAQSTRNSKFISHFKEVHPDEELRYSCYHCKLLMGKYRSFIRHVASHTEKRFACDICDKNFAQKMTLVQHMNSHSSLKLFECDECDLKFKQNSSLFKHRKTKHTNSSITCTECAKSFVNKETLMQHMKSKHSMKKDIVCKQCSKTFASRSAFSYHQSSKHPKGQVAGDKRICKSCDKSFKSQAILNVHMKQSSSCCRDSK